MSALNILFETRTGQLQLQFVPAWELGAADFRFLFRLYSFNKLVNAGQQRGVGGSEIKIQKLALREEAYGATRRPYAGPKRPAPQQQKDPRRLGPCTYPRAGKRRAQPRRRR